MPLGRVGKPPESSSRPADVRIWFDSAGSITPARRPAPAPCSLISLAAGWLDISLEASENGAWQTTGCSPDKLSATILILDPHPGTCGQVLSPVPGLGLPPRNCPGPICLRPFADQSEHLVSTRWKIFWLVGLDPLGLGVGREAGWRGRLCLWVIACCPGQLMLHASSSTRGQ